MINRHCVHFDEKQASSFKPRNPLIAVSHFLKAGAQGAAQARAHADERLFSRTGRGTNKLVEQIVTKAADAAFDQTRFDSTKEMFPNGSLIL